MLNNQSHLTLFGQIENMKPPQLISNQKRICRLILKTYNHIINSGQLCTYLLKQMANVIKKQIYQPVYNYVSSEEDELGEIFYSKTFSKICSGVFSINGKKLLFQQKQQIQNLDKNLFILNLLKGNPIPDLCLNCQNYYYHNCVINLCKESKIFPIQYFNFQGREQQLKFAKYLCSALNAGSACIMIGMTKQHRVKGITVDKSLLYQLETIVMNIKRYYIMPSKQQNEIINISFEEIKKSYFQKQKKQSFFHQKQFGLIKIYVNTKAVNKVYFVKTKNQRGGYDEFGMWKNPQNEFADENSYKQILKSYRRPKIKSIHGNIKCQKTERKYETKISSIIAIENKKSIIPTSQFGREPVQRYEYQYIVIYTSNSSQITEFISRLNQLSIPFDYYQIYERIIKNTLRNVFYLTHKKRYDELQKIAENIDSKNKHLILLKIKPHLTLLKQQYFPQAYSILSQRYRMCFGKDLQVRFKQYMWNQGVKYEYYFCFKNNEGIFAFTCLEMANIRSNFISDKKVSGSKPFTF